jgi:hypothetical protein
MRIQLYAPAGTARAESVPFSAACASRSVASVVGQLRGIDHDVGREPRLRERLLRDRDAHRVVVRAIAAAAEHEKGELVRNDVVSLQVFPLVSRSTAGIALGGSF